MVYHLRKIAANAFLKPPRPSTSMSHASVCHRTHLTIHIVENSYRTLFPHLNSLLLIPRRSLNVLALRVSSSNRVSRCPHAFPNLDFYRQPSPSFHLLFHAIRCAANIEISQLPSRTNSLGTTSFPYALVLRESDRFLPSRC